uniref:Putative regulation of interferon-beta production ovary overexpressed n=1 Tax=Rhipicephalus microplus TaxID=6941 RepID=A0A6M2D410_RHIMP
MAQRETDDKCQRSMYRVCCFGAHTEWKTVEFLEKLDAVQVCSWCGVASARTGVLSCSHMVCEECHFIACKEAVPVCLIDKKTLNSQTIFDTGLNEALQHRKVRCENVDSGCDFTGRIGQLDGHLSMSCAFYLKDCSKCKEAVVYKDLLSHYEGCAGVAVVFVDAKDSQSLLDDIENVRRELEQAFDLTSSDVRDAVGLLTDQLEMLRSQLTTRSERREDSVILADSKQSRVKPTRFKPMPAASLCFFPEKLRTFTSYFCFFLYVPTCRRKTAELPYVLCYKFRVF